MSTPSNIPVTTGSGANIATFDVTRNSTTEKVQAVMHLEWTFTNVTATGNTVVLGLAGLPATYLVGFHNLSFVDQTINLTAYDNASAASGTIVSEQVNIGASQIITFPPPGIPLANGCTVALTGAPSGAGIMVMVR